VTASVNVPTNALPGAYAIAVVTQDTSGAPSHSLSIPLTITQDYILGNVSPTTQTVSVGQSTTYNLSVLPVGAAYSNAVTLSCTVAPLFVGTCALSPNPVDPLSNSTSAAVVMTVTTQTTNAQLWRPGANRWPWLYAVWLALPGIAVWAARGKPRRRGPAILLGLTIALLFSLTSCGAGGTNGGSTGPGGDGSGTLPGTYTVTVVGTPASLSQPGGSSVTLTVQ
jgi:peptidoglycan/LPS O-acetylase OafA/YrhL